MTRNEQAWYLRVRRDEVGERAVLVGDRGRVLLAARLLEDARILNEDRGLTTATGSWRGERITVSAFGMGAPIAVAVLHELADLGVRKVVRLGTAMSIGPTRLGELVIASGAVRGEAVSRTYLPIEYPAVSDPALLQALSSAAADGGHAYRVGLIGTYDGFYSEMFESGLGSTTVDDRFAQLGRHGVAAVDMETSALLVAGLALGVETASCCLASVEGGTNRTMQPDDRMTAEADLLRVGFDALVASDTPSLPTRQEISA